MNLTGTQASPMAGALDRQLEADKEFEARIKAIFDSPPLSPIPAPAPPAVPAIPRTGEARYAKGWSDAWEAIRPQLYDLHRRYVLTGRQLASASRSLKWLPVICFGCTLLGFVLGWWCKAGGIFAASAWRLG